MHGIYVEENGIYQIDLSAAVEHMNDLNAKYQTIGGFLSDVDFIAETNDAIFLIEYKNTEIPNTQNPGAFREKIKDEKFYDSVLKKYYCSVFYLLACKKTKPINFILIIESESMDNIIRKKVWASIEKRLPYKLQKMPEISLTLINDFKVLSIQEWNGQYPMFPLTMIKSTDVAR